MRGDDVRIRLQQRSDGRPLRQRGDHDGNDGMDPAATLRPAAVLVPIIERPDGLTVLLTQRTTHLAAHAGQISFPGGGAEQQDAGPDATALRETEEEIGLDRQHVSLIGRLDTYVTRTGFRIEPLVGLIAPPFMLRPDPHEVAEIFEVPLSFFLDPSRRVRESVLFQGQQRSFWAFPYENRYIWGATAGMLVNLVDCLTADPLVTPE
jgi:8-oxo-dGTP pyrophosphatase MutT (NUDIX family)